MKAFLLTFALWVFTGTAQGAEMDIFAQPAPAPRKVAAPKPEPVPSPAPVVERNVAKLYHGPFPAPTQWVNTMEASMGFGRPSEDGVSAPMLSRPLVWVGWSFAVFFAFMWLSQGFRARRRAQSMLRAGERDAIFLPPSRRR